MTTITRESQPVPIGVHQSLNELDQAIEIELSRGNYREAYELTKERDYLTGAYN